MTRALYTQHMAVRTRFSDAAATVFFSGELDVCSEHVLQRALKEVVEQQPERLVLDLTDVTFLDCAAARVIAAAGRALPESRKAVIHRPSRAVRRLLELTGMSAGFWFDHSPPGRVVRSPAPAPVGAAGTAQRAGCPA